MWALKHGFTTSSPLPTSLIWSQLVTYIYPASKTETHIPGLLTAVVDTEATWALLAVEWAFSSVSSLSSAESVISSKSSSPSDPGRSPLLLHCKKKNCLETKWEFRCSNGSVINVLQWHNGLAAIVSQKQYSKSGVTRKRSDNKTHYNNASFQVHDREKPTTTVDSQK